MAEIFFIASDERALDLIESLRIQSPKSLTFETDLPSAVRRLPKEKPRYVFIQSTLDGTPCEEIAAQAKASVDGEPPRLVLLRDEETPPGPPPACFGCSVDLTLPTPDLTLEVMQFLEGEASSEVPNVPVSDLSDLFTLEDPTDFEIPSFDDAAFDPAFDPHLAPLWQADQPEKEIIFDDILAKSDAAPPVIPAAAPANRKHEPDAAPDEIVFFVPEPPPAPEAERQKEAKPAKEVKPPKQAKPLKQAEPAKEEEPLEEAALSEPAAPNEAAPPATPTFEEDQVPVFAQKRPKSGPRSLYPGPEQIYRKPPQLCGTPLEGEEEAPPEGTSPKGGGRLGRYLALGGVVLLALGALLWQRTPTSQPELARKTEVAPVAPAKPAAAAPATPAATPAPEAARSAQGLPAFVPKVPADPAYAAKHPGWERYQGDKMQFRIFRDKGAVKAIQVVGEEGADISEAVVRSSFKEATGSDLPAAWTATDENGVRVESRKTKDGAEVAIYRSGNNRILGFVLQLADKK